ncbi:MAG: TonB-dependent receptor [Chitinophagales bacterium]|nr:TonB-dependent receptor [Chitinophagales bacterium]
MPKFYFLGVLALLTSSPLFSQITNFSIRGIVQDNKSKENMEYCTISLYNSEDQALVTGIVSDMYGKFLLDQLKAGTYNLEVSFIGYDSKTIENLSLSKENPTIDLGTIYLGTDAQIVKEVEVTALKSSVKYELDKKVVDVDKQIAASNGTAADVLATVPSIQSDINGDIRLRGSSGFTVFINGRPSVLDANDALRQIPASTIENIEIITNPSARYDAEGTAGIINIITKKKSNDGFSGIINARGGMFSTYGGDATFVLSRKKFTYTISGNYNHRENPGSYSSELNTSLNDTTVSTINDGSKNRIHNNYGIKAGLEYRPTEQQYIAFNYQYGGFKMVFDDELDFQFINRTTGEEESFTNYNKSTREGPFHEFSIDYGYDFKNKSKLSVHGSFNVRGFNEEIDNQRKDSNNELIFATLSTEEGPSNRLRINVDYSIPIKDHSKFEIGMMQQLNNSRDENIAYQLNLTSGEFEDQNQFYSDTKYDRNIRAFYGIFSSKWEKFSYQLGLRAENTNRNSEVLNRDTSYLVKRLDLFPSLHLAYNASEQHQFFISYSKRINRPRGWYLEPNSVYTDANTLFRGNPSILPEYIHSIEAGWLFNFKKKGSWSNELYFRREVNSTQIVRIPLSYELTEQFPENIGNSSSVGLESSLSLLPLSWWNTDLLANIFYFKLKGSYADEIFDRSSFSYNLRWNNYFTIKKNTKIQFNASYSSPIVNAQGRERYTLSFDGGIKQDLFDKQLSLGLQIRDMFNTYISRSYAEGNNFTSSRINNPRGPSLIFSASYKINNFKAKKSEYTDGGDDF